MQKSVEDAFAEKIGKLPAWARNYVHKLERDRAELQRMMLGTESKVCWTTFHTDAKSYIPDYATVRILAKGGEIRVWLRDDGDVGIAISGDLIILPEASNLIKVRAG